MPPHSWSAWQHSSSSPPCWRTSWCLLFSRVAASAGSPWFCWESCNFETADPASYLDRWEHHFCGNRWLRGRWRGGLVCFHTFSQLPCCCRYWQWRSDLLPGWMRSCSCSTECTHVFSWWWFPITGIGGDSLWLHCGHPVDWVWWWTNATAGCRIVLFTHRSGPGWLQSWTELGAIALENCNALEAISWDFSRSSTPMEWQCWHCCQTACLRYIEWIYQGFAYSWCANCQAMGTSSATAACCSYKAIPLFLAGISQVNLSLQGTVFRLLHPVAYPISTCWTNCGRGGLSSLSRPHLLHFGRNTLVTLSWRHEQLWASTLSDFWIQTFWAQPSTNQGFLQ